MNYPNTSNLLRSNGKSWGKSWLINVTEIRGGGSAIIGNNRLAFFAIHYFGLFMITISLVASLIVIITIYSKWRSSVSKLKFPDRFPLYLGIAEVLLGVCHITDHIYLVYAQVYPSSYWVQAALSLNLGFFFGYQQGMHLSIAAHTYLRVVHRKRLNLGTWDWKIHLIWVCILVGMLGPFYIWGSYGNAGYWMANDASTFKGQMLGVMFTVTTTSNAICTTVGYYIIKRTVINSKAHLRTYTSPGSCDKCNNFSGDNHSVATQCLTTFVWLASCLYCPLAFLFWFTSILQIFMGVLEPISCFLIVIVANSSGWANAYGFFKNESIKRKKSKGKLMRPVSG